MLLLYPVDNTWGNKCMIIVKFVAITMRCWFNSALLWDAQFFQKRGCFIIFFLFLFSFVWVALGIIFKAFLWFEGIKLFLIKIMLTKSEIFRNFP